MKLKTFLRTGLPICLGVTALAGCTTADPKVYAGLASAPHLKSDTSDESGRIPYRYKRDVDFRKYDKVIIDPVTIYRGADHQFVKLSEDDKTDLADYMQTKFQQALQTRFSRVTSPIPGTLRIHLTLTGAKATTALLGPASHLDLGGGAYNTVQSVRGREGSMTGSVIYAVDIYDSMTNSLLAAYVTKQFPNAMNVGATFGALKAAHVAIDKGADALMDELCS
ncbi:DUF3313 domain-containing protein [Rhizobium paknamense]|uniref:DUF3313 domain-containing protein n=1 Tax=Rhizobium paknamense TaxID=1206817 RepID=A0ABU0IKQ4_9HYPH|nr:DUF3313 domain-containing protein [Rhizobium paknamense]MDQ0458242.1 hypothetical protein [Rhizobium paknamense]